MRNVVALALVSVVLAARTTMPYQPYAREVKKKPTFGGVIALKSTYIDADRTYADSIMAKNCGTNPVKVLEEGEVEVGKTTTSNATETKEDKSTTKLFGLNFTNPGEKNTEKTSTVTAVKEWQIAYECGVVATATPAPTKAKKK
jgi:hypothetical protein